MRKTFVLIVFFAALFFLFLHPFEGSGDFYHHVNTGKYILTHRALPHTDPFTFTALGAPWVAYAWGSGVILYLTFLWFGTTGISLLTAFAGLATCALLYRLFVTHEIPRKIRLLAVALTAVLLSVRFPQRPEIFSYPLVVLLFLINKWRQRQPGVSLMFPVVILVWANLYGSSVLAGLILLLLFAVEDMFFDKHKTKQPLFYASVLISVPVSLLNGYGLDSVLYFFRFIPAVAVYEGEWSGVIQILRDFPPQVLPLYGKYIAVYALYLGVCILLLFPARKKLFSRPLLPALSAAAVIPFFAFRQLALTAILTSIPMAYYMTVIHKPHPWIVRTIMVAVLVMAVITVTARPIGLSATIQREVKLTRFILRQHLTGRAFNHVNIGAALTYYLYPGVRVFIDTRDDVFVHSSAASALRDAFEKNASVLPIVREYSPDMIIMDLNSDGLNYRDILSSPLWSTVYEQDGFVVRTPKRQEAR